MTGGLKSVQMDGLLMRLDCNGFKISLFQLQMAVQLETTASWFLMAMVAT